MFILLLNPRSITFTRAIKAHGASALPTTCRPPTRYSLSTATGSNAAEYAKMVRVLVLKVDDLEKMVRLTGIIAAAFKIFCEKIFSHQNILRKNFLASKLQFFKLILSTKVRFGEFGREECDQMVK